MDYLPKVKGYAEATAEHLDLLLESLSRQENIRSITKSKKDNGMDNDSHWIYLHLTSGWTIAYEVNQDNHGTYYRGSVGTDNFYLYKTENSNHRSNSYAYRHSRYSTKHPELFQILRSITQEYFDSLNASIKRKIEAQKLADLESLRKSTKPADSDPEVAIFTSDPEVAISIWDRIRKLF